MVFHRIRGWWLPLAALALASCAVVDRFGSRITDSNLTSQYAMNQEMLLNIVRASRHQALNFVAITQVAGSQTETLNTGLPTVTLGPQQTAAQHQAVFAANSVSSAAQGSFQSNPLVSSAFQDGMLTPITPRSLALLIASHPREPVYYAAIDGIKFTVGGMTVKYRNDPSDDLDANGKFDPQCWDKVYHSYDRRFLLDDQTCSFSKFVNFLQVFLAVGLTAELVACEPNSSVPGCKSAKSAGGSSAGQGSQNATANASSIGRLCFDRPLAARSLRAANPKPFCGTKPSAKATEITLNFPVLGKVSPELVMRSPSGIFNYLGKLLHDGTANRIMPYTGTAKALRGSFLDITLGGADIGCFVFVSYDGESYCVPQGAETTAMMLAILEQLRNLSITPSDLNAATSVRLVN